VASSADPLAYGGSGAAVTRSGLDRVAHEVVTKEEKKLKFKRHRMEIASADVDYINSNNANFNKKIQRSFDKYTVEIRQNLERGTAI